MSFTVENRSSFATGRPIFKTEEEQRHLQFFISLTFNFFSKAFSPSGNFLGRFKIGLFSLDYLKNRYETWKFSQGKILFLFTLYINKKQQSMH